LDTRTRQKFRTKRKPFQVQSTQAKRGPLAPLLTLLLLVNATLLRVVAALAGLAVAEAGLLLAVVLVLLVAVEARLLLGIQILLVSAVLQLLRVHPDLVQQPGVLLRVNLIGSPAAAA